MRGWRAGVEEVKKGGEGRGGEGHGALWAGWGGWGWRRENGLRWGGGGSRLGGCGTAARVVALAGSAEEVCPMVNVFVLGTAMSCPAASRA